jgi:hypothetical protein
MQKADIFALSGLTFRDIFVVLITSDVMFVLHRKGFIFHYFVQIAYSLIEEQEGKKRACDAYISFVGLLADPRYCGTFYTLLFRISVFFMNDSIPFYIVLLSRFCSQRSPHNLKTKEPQYKFELQLVLNLE